MKRLLAALLLALPVLSLAAPNQILVRKPDGSITTVGADAAGNLNVACGSLIPAGATYFSCSVVGQAATLLECAALASGRQYVITDIQAGSSTATAGTFAVQSGTGTNCGTSTTQVFPPAPMTTAARLATPANTSPPMTYSPRAPLLVTVSHAVCVIGVATNTANVVIAGYYYTP
jgi:hypothetical protein